MMKIYSSDKDTSVIIIVLGKTEENCQRAANRYFINNCIKGYPVTVNLVNSTYSVEEDATILSFNNKE